MVREAITMSVRGSVLGAAVHARILAALACLVWSAGLGAALPYQGTDRHMGVASCASSVCHGSVKPNPNYRVRLDEYVRWSHDDAHAKAFAALASEAGRSIASKLGLGAPQTEASCLACHADFVDPARRGAKFDLSDGVGCEACHGGSEHWIASHTNRQSSYADDVRQGMYPTAGLLERAALCESCHVADTGKFATHRLMGAGHPRLSFELDTYLALEPPHYTVDAAYQARKPAFSHAQTWAVGQLQASALQLTLLLGQALPTQGLFPELSLFNCAACHDSSMRHPEWRRRAMTQFTAPGTVPLNDAYWRMSWLIARALDPAEGERVLGLAQTLQKSAATGRDQISAPARALGNIFKRIEARVAGERWNAVQAGRILQSLIDGGADGEFRDYLGAEQAAMAAELLLIDTGAAQRSKAPLDALFRAVKDDRLYRADEFAAAMRALRGAP